LSKFLAMNARPRRLPRPHAAVRADARPKAPPNPSSRALAWTPLPLASSSIYSESKATPRRGAWRRTPSNKPRLNYEVTQDGIYLLRVQPELLRGGLLRLFVPPERAENTAESIPCLDALRIAVTGTGIQVDCLLEVSQLGEARAEIHVVGVAHTGIQANRLAKRRHSLLAPT
jgi:hypothetical protein